MNIRVYPRVFFEKIVGTEIEKNILNNYKVISINTPEYKPLNITREIPPFSDINHPNLLVLYFHDYYKPLQDVILMSEEDALKIKKFITGKEKKIFVHCTAGISRSGAVGSFLNKFFNDINSDDYKKFIYNYADRIMPNTWVLNMLKKVYY